MSKDCRCDKRKGDDCCFNCCFDKDFVQDKVCCEWKALSSPAELIRRAIFINQLKCPFVTSGFVKYDCGIPGSQIGVRFLINGTQIGDPITLDEGGCLTFTATRFDEIQIVLPATGPATFEGEICVTPRYRLN
jgi:hypothetical protein